MTPDQEKKLDGVVTLVGRIDERTEQMQSNHEREVDGIHARITDVRGEARQDVNDLRGEVKRISGLVGAAVSAVIAAAGQAFGLGGGN